ncbi:MAG: hypothetical protein WB709_14170 [Solirubrobacteraceae bacterium]
MTTATRIHPGLVIRQTLTLYRRLASVWLPGSIVVFGIAGILAAIAVTISPLMIYVSFLISDIAIALFTGMIVGLVADTRRNDESNMSVSQLLGSIEPVFGRVILVGLVTGIGVFIGFIIIVVPGLVLATIWSVATPVVVRERPSGLRALGRSRELVRGNGWRVFSVIFVLIFLVGLLASGVDLAANSAGTGAGIVVRVIIEIFTAPLGALAGAILYLDLSQESE